MSMKRCLYASTGLLSLLGFIGVFTQARVFWHSLPLPLTLSISSSSRMK